MQQTSNNEFGKKLRQIRESRNMSQDEFAILLGTSKQVISRYETAQRIPKITTVCEYAQKLGVSLEELTNSLGKAIREARGGLSLREYAKKIGISHTHLDSIEKGYDPRTGKPVAISLDTFIKLSNGTGIPLEKLIFLLKYSLNDLENIEKIPAANRTPIDNMVYNYFSSEIKKRLPILELLQDLSEDELLEVINYIKYLQSKRDRTKEAE